MNEEGMGVGGVSRNATRPGDAATRHRHDDVDEDDHGDGNANAHLDVLPPHSPGEDATALLEGHRPTREDVRFVDYLVQTVAPFQEGIDVRHHQVFHAIHLGSNSN